MDGFPVGTRLHPWQQVKHMHLNPGRDCTSVTRRAAATDGWAGAAVLCRLESFLSHSGECLWLSLKESRGGWRQAEGGVNRGGRGYCAGRRRKRRRSCASGTTGICIPRSSVMGWERRWDTGTELGGSIGRTVAEVQQSKKECCKILPSPRRASVGRWRC